MRPLLTLAAFLLAGPAAALSCLPADVARTYGELAKAPERYTMVVGKLTFDEGLLPRTDWNDQMATPARTDIPARLVGSSLQSDGFTGPYARDITLRALCFGPWCAGGRSGAKVLAFVNLETSPPSVEITPCGGHRFDASADTLERALSCYRGESCVPVERR